MSPRTLLHAAAVACLYVEAVIAHPADTAEWGLRFTITLLFPK
jgi:hypothetical protein